MARTTARQWATDRDAYRDRWDLIDPLLTDDRLVGVAKSLVGLATTDWTADVVIDLDDPATSAFLGRHRVTTAVPLRCVVDDVQREELRQRLQAIYGVQMRIEATANTVVGQLRNVGIDVRVLKGLASAQLDYPWPELRQTGDVDLAIPVGTVDAAFRHLKQSGYGNYGPGRSWTHLMKGAVVRAANGIEVDLHDRLFQRSPMSPALFEDGGQELPNLAASALGPEARLVHAAGHFILSPPGTRRMSGFLDIIVMRNRADLDMSYALAIAKRLGVARMVGSSLRLEASLSGRDDDDLQVWPQADWLERRTRLQAERNLVLDHMSRFREVPRSRWLSYLPHWVVPDARQRKLFKGQIRKQWHRSKATLQR